MHPNIGGLLNPVVNEEHNTEVRSFIFGNAQKKLEYLESTLIGDKKFLVEDSFTIADSYLYIVLTWTGFVGIDLTPYPRVKAYMAHIENLANVKDAIARMASNPATTF